MTYKNRHSIAKNNLVKRSFVFPMLCLLSTACENYDLVSIGDQPNVFLPSPSEVTLEDTGGAILITWSYQQTDLVKTFRIYRRDGRDETDHYVAVATTRDVNYADDSVSNGIEYFYEVAPVSNLNVEGEHSATISIIPLNQFPSKSILSEPSPVDQDISSLLIKWLPVNDVDFHSYLLLRSRELPVSLSSTVVQEIADVQAASFQDSGLLPDTRYYYRIFVFNEAGRSTGSNIVSGKTPKNSPPNSVMLSQPLQIENGLKLAWNQSLDSDFSNYRLYRSTSSPVDTVQISPIAIIHEISTTEFADEDVQADTEYYYKLLVFDKFGLSAASNEVKGVVSQ